MLVVGKGAAKEVPPGDKRGTNRAWRALYLAGEGGGGGEQAVWRGGEGAGGGLGGRGALGGELTRRDAARVRACGGWRGGNRVSTSHHVVTTRGHGHQCGEGHTLSAQIGAR